MFSICATPAKSARPLRILATVGLVFGALTLYSGGKVLFGAEADRLAAGAYVPFIVWFNFLAGFAYIAAAIGLHLRARWAMGLSIAIVGATLIAIAAFAIHILGGGAYETRTVGALALRVGVWLLIACAARRALPKATP